MDLEQRGALRGALPELPGTGDRAGGGAPGDGGGGGLEGLIATLCALPGPTGQEDAVTAWVGREWEGRGEVTRTRVGNLLLHLPGPGPRVLLCAHADELSLVVRSVTPEGFLRVLPGERDTFPHPLFPGTAVRILADGGPLPGVFATTTGHALTPEQKTRTALGWDDVFVDAGLGADEARAAGIHAGTRIVWEAPVRRVGRLLVGKALDNRLGVAVLVELARRLDPARLRADLTLAVTVQEEIGFVGVASVARGRDFDVGVVVDNGVAGDIPTVSEAHVTARLGDGPALVHRDSAAHFSPRLLRELRAAAERAGVPAQDAVLHNYLSEGAHLLRQGMETALVAPPIRYSHSPFEAVDPRDVEATVRLLLAWLSTGEEG